VSEIPVIDLFGHLLVPLQGDIGDRQAESLRDRVLSRLRAKASESLILDASGIWVLDSHLCSVLAALANAANLMGARSLLCGMTPEMVMTLQAMGIELSTIQTAINLQDALHKLGYQLVKREGQTETARKREEPKARRPAPAEAPTITSVADVARDVLSGRR
jgi:rsbT antagonist protein RsbS